MKVSTACATTVGVFAAVAAAQTRTGANIFSTNSPLSVRAGTPATVRWKTTDKNPVTVYLVASPSADIITFSTLTQAISNPGSLTWTPSTHLPNGGNYMYQIIDDGRVNYSPHFALSGGSEPTCSWEGHCAGAPCKVDDDCSDALSCQFGVCAMVNIPTVSGVTCSWPGHCAGATCKADGDCSDELVCRNTKCTNLNTNAASPGASSTNPSNSQQTSTSDSNMASTSTSSSSQQKPPLAAIIGGTVGGVAALLIIGLLAICIHRRRNANVVAELPRPPLPENNNPYFGGVVSSPHIKAELDANDTSRPGTVASPTSPAPKPSWMQESLPGSPLTTYGNVGKDRVHELA